MIGHVELQTALERSLNCDSNHSDAQRRIAELDRRPCSYRSSFAVEELDVRFADGSAMQLIFKDVGRDALLDEARVAKPAFLHNPLREIETYRAILKSAGLGTATFHGACVDPRAGRYWLFLERVPGVPLVELGDFAIWQEVARRLAIMHSRLSRAGESSALPHLLHYDEDFYRLWPRRALEFLGSGGHSPGDCAAAARLLAERYDSIIDRLLALPRTFIHGEFYGANVLVAEAPAGFRVCPVDWEMAAFGPCLMDLAALTSGKWSEEEKVRLALTYRETLDREQRADLAPTDFLTALDLCRLHLAVQWLGWSRQWSPPEEHAYNWLGEALGQAEKLCL